MMVLVLDVPAFMYVLQIFIIGVSLDFKKLNFDKYIFI